MAMESTRDLTGLLLSWSRGDSQAREALLPLVYGELRGIAGRYMRQERSDHTLQPTALIHEAYLRLVDQKRVDWQNRAHFFGVAANVMRRILVDHARRRGRVKRGGAERTVSLEELSDVADQRTPDLLALDAALTHLAARDPRKASIVELHFFGGLTVAETAEVLGCSTATVTRHWRTAKVWIFRQLRDPEGHG